MIKQIKIFWGPDKDFESMIVDVKKRQSFSFIIGYLDKHIHKIEGADSPPEQPLKVENLIVCTDDYGRITESALLGFCKNILENTKFEISNIWLCNPPQKVYDDIRLNYDKSIIEETKNKYKKITVKTLQKIAKNFSNEIIGQSHVIANILPSIYSLTIYKDKKPAALLFVGGSGLGKTETAKYIGKCLKSEVTRIQFSMQQTTKAAEYIFGSDHNNDSLARDLIRRKSNLILIDEFDKVPPVFYNAFYQMLDEGIFVDKNYKVDVSQCIIICTSNFSNENKAREYLGDAIYSRFTKVIQFKNLNKEDMIKIARNTLKEVLDGIRSDIRKGIDDKKILDYFLEIIKQQNGYQNIRKLKNDIKEAVSYSILKAKDIL